LGLSQVQVGEQVFAAPLTLFFHRDQSEIGLEMGLLVGGQMKFYVSAHYELPNGQHVERPLRKNGEIAKFDTQDEAEQIAIRMIDLLPKASELTVQKDGSGKTLWTSKGGVNNG